MNEPKLRFKADDGSQFPDWEEHEIAELIQLYNEKVSSDCQLPILTSSKKNGIEYQEEHFAGKQRHDIEGYNVLPRNYCTYRNRSDGTDFTFNINKLCDKGIVSKFYPVFKEKDCDLFFLVSLLNNERKTVRKIAYTAKGTGQKVLSITDLRNITVNMPSLPEQQKIAEFLSTVDTVIAKQKETVSAWEERKKGVMQKLFSQEVRFKADDGSDFPEWEKKKINDVAYLNPKTGTIPNEFYYMDLGGVDRGSWRDKKVVLKEEAPSRAQRIAMLGDCFFQSVRPLNMGHYLLKNKLDKPVVASTGFIQMRMKKDICPDFIFQLLFDENLNKEVELRCTGQTYPAINVDGFSDIAVRVPCLAEQQKIADCLSSLDEVIEKQKATSAAWEELKKGLLQQMFV